MDDPGLTGSCERHHIFDCEWCKEVSELRDEAEKWKRRFEWLAETNHGVNCYSYGWAAWSICPMTQKRTEWVHESALEAVDKAIAAE